MEKLIKKVANILIIVLSAIALIAGLVAAFKGGGKSLEKLLLPSNKDLYASLNTTLNISFNITYIFLFAILAMLAFFVIMQVFSTRKTMIRTLILLAVAAVIIVLSYIPASSAELSDVALQLKISEGVYKWAGTALNITYIVFFGVILAFLGSFVYTKIKK
jgi:hypothetical protein